MSTISGTDLRFYLGGVPVGHATTCTLDMTKETRQTVSKDNTSNWAESEGSTKSATLSFEGFYTLAATIGGVTVEGADDLFDLFDGTDLIAWKFSDEETGNVEYSGNAIMTGLSFTAAVNENANHSSSLQVTGPVSKVTIS